MEDIQETINEQVQEIVQQIEELIQQNGDEAQDIPMDLFKSNSTDFVEEVDNAFNPVRFGMIAVYIALSIGIILLARVFLKEREKEEQEDKEVRKIDSKQDEISIQGVGEVDLNQRAQSMKLERDIETESDTDSDNSPVAKGKRGRAPPGPSPLRQRAEDEQDVKDDESESHTQNDENSENQGEYEVEEIIKSRDRTGRRLKSRLSGVSTEEVDPNGAVQKRIVTHEYQVKWRGRNNRFNSWESGEILLAACPQIVESYERKISRGKLTREGTSIMAGSSSTDSDSPGAHLKKSPSSSSRKSSLNKTPSKKSSKKPLSENESSPTKKVSKKKSSLKKKPTVQEEFNELIAGTVYLDRSSRRRSSDFNRLL